MARYLYACRECKEELSYKFPADDQPCPMCGGKIAWVESLDQLYEMDAVDVATEALRAQLAERGKTIERLQAVNERDRTQVAIGVNAVTEAIRKREWLRLGRGSYEWNDDRWMDEFGHAIDEIHAALNELRKVSLDHSDCPVSREDVLKARAALKGNADDTNA